MVTLDSRFTNGMIICFRLQSVVSWHGKINNNPASIRSICYIHHDHCIVNSVERKMNEAIRGHTHLFLVFTVW